MKSIFKLIKSISVDVWMIYKNFLHWNLSKILISLGSICLSFLLALPFIIVLIIMYFSFSINQYITSIDVSLYDLLGFLSNRPFVFTIFMIFALLMFFSALIGYSYRRVLFIKLNLSYIEGKKLKYLKNKYFDFKLLRKYFKIMALVSLLLSIPIVTFFILFFILFFIFGGSQGVQGIIASNQLNIISIISLILLLVCLGAFIYISYRLYFSVIMLVDNKNYEEENNGPKFYIKESFHKTKDLFSFFKFGLIIIISGFIILPIGTLNDYYSNSLDQIKAYEDYNLLGDVEKGEVDKNPNYDFIYDLNLKYHNNSPEEIKSIEVTYFYLYYFLYILNYLLIFGLIEMITLSFYKNEIMKKKSLISSFL